MPRLDFTPMSIEQEAWLREWATRQARVLERVIRGLEHLHCRSGQPAYRHAYAAALELRELARTPMPNVWAVPRWTGTAPDLTPERREHLAGIAASAKRDLERVAEYFDKAGCPSRAISRSVREAIDRLGAIGVHLHYLTCEGARGGAVQPELPTETAKGGEGET